MTYPQDKQKRKRKLNSNALEDMVGNGKDTNHNGEVTPEGPRPFWVLYDEVYEKLSRLTAKAKTSEECIFSTRIVDITSDKFTQDIKKLDLSSIDHWAFISTQLVNSWDKFFCVPGHEGWSFGDLIPINCYKPNYFGLRHFLLKKKGIHFGDSESSQKKKRVAKKDDNSRNKVSKPLEGMVDDKPLPLIEHMNRVVTAIKNNLVNGECHIDYLKLVLNPHSFSSTIYNIFTISFLIREGIVSMSIGKDGSPRVKLCPASASKTKNDNEVGKSHFIIDLTTSEWKSLVKRLNITSAMISCPNGSTEDDMFYEKFMMSQKERSKIKN